MTIAATTPEQNRITPGVFESTSGRDRRKSINNNYIHIYLRDLWRRSLSVAAVIAATRYREKSISPTTRRKKNDVKKKIIMMITK